MVRLEDITSMNPWWTKGISFTHEDKSLSELRKNPNTVHVKRQKPVFKEGNIYIIKGPRRVGKTVWIKEIIEELIENATNPIDIFYYSLDNVKSGTEIENMLDDFLYKPHTGTRYIFLDEVQNVAGWTQVMQGMQNAGKLNNAVTVVTGSIARLMGTETMPGRGTEGNTYTMRCLGFKDFCITLLSDIRTHYGVNRVNSLLGYNFTNDEMAALLAAIENANVSLDEPLDVIYSKLDAISAYAVPLRKLFDVYLHTGGYPSSMNNYIQNSQSIGKNTYEEIYLYAKNDAAAIMGAGRPANPENAAIAMKGVLHNLGSYASNSKLARSAGMNQITFKSYMERLGNSYVFITIESLDREFQRAGFRKTYFGDVLMHYAIGSSVSGEEPNAYSVKMLNSYDIGIIVEEVVAAGLVMVKEDDPMITYHSYLKFLRSGSKEIDFLFKKSDGSYIGIEVKYQNDPSTKNDLTRSKLISEYILLTKDTMKRDGSVIAVPVYLFLALLGKSAKCL